LTVWESVKLAFAMFSRVPVKNARWDNANMRYMMCAFPLVGVVVGGLVLLWALVSARIGVPDTLRALGFTLLPILITGGVHLDGFCDTADALSSHAPPERKREILKDPHAGAFAIIALCCYMLAYFALAHELPRDMKTCAVFAVCFVMTRALSGLCVLGLPSSSGTGLARTFRESGDVRRGTIILAVIIAVCAVAAVLLDPLSGGAAVAVSGLCGLYLMSMSRRKFGGMSGDLAGYFLQVCELAQLLVIVINGGARSWYLS
jgi:adenosylcobinamide-GDP ribazoletransferase